MDIDEAKSEPIEIRMTARVMALLQDAAASTGNSVAEFLLDTGVQAAEEILANRQVFHLDHERWQAFQDALARPTATNKPRLARLLAEKSVLE